jgi:HemY protein
LQARNTLPNEPMTLLLRAQAAQLAGDRSTSRRIFEGMLTSPDTEPLGLRGLFVEAEREKAADAARHFAERALRLNPKLAWASDALFDIQCRAGHWTAAIETLASARKHGLVTRQVADRRRAVLLTAKATAAEDHEPDRALALAVEAHNLAPDLVPAAVIAGRMLASRGNTPKAAKVLERAFARSPHPDLATVYAYARVGDSPRDRLARVKRLADHNPYSIESAIAVANAAIDAKAFDDARDALAPMLEERLTQRIATLMARIESEQYGDKGRVREWLARAVNAQRDPTWTADGMTSDEWAPISPVTGTLDAFQWKVPVESLQARDTDLMARKVEELVALGAPVAVEEADEDDGPVTVEAVTVRPTATPARPTPSVAPVVPEPARAVAPATGPTPGARPTAAAEAPAETGATRPVPETVTPAVPLAAEPAVARTTAVPAAAALVPAVPPTTPTAPTAAVAGPATPSRGPAETPADHVATAAAAPSVAVPPAPDAPPAAAAAVPREAPAPASPSRTVEVARVEPAPPLPEIAAPVTTAPATAQAAAPRAPEPSRETPARDTPPRDSPPREAPRAPTSDRGVATRDTPRSETPREALTRDTPRDTGREPRIFIVPQAPDDPGPDAGEADTTPGKGARPPYRALP